jgi:sialate O-acetylesterase
MKSTLALVSVIFLIVASTHAELRLPAVISDHAMLQAAKPVALWGWATPGAQVKVAFVGQTPDPAETFTATADANGKWSGQLPAMKAGQAGQLKIDSNKDASKTVADLLVGEVWLGSGQSNMVYRIDGSYGNKGITPEEMTVIQGYAAEAVKEAGSLQQPVRYFEAGERRGDGPEDDVRGKWVVADPTTVPTFSAVAWYFAVALQEKLNVPVGLVVSASGGTEIQCWISKETLESTSVGAAIEEREKKKIAAVTPEMIAKYEADVKAFLAAHPDPASHGKDGEMWPTKPYTLSLKSPTVLYNGMIHGLEPYTIRGILWFQAEANKPQPLQYGELFQALIKEWRADWKEELPFYFVEENNAREVTQTQPVQLNNLSIVREQQHQGLLLPGVGMASAIDLGTIRVHFPNKQPLGIRLAALALKDCYGQPIGQVNSPLYKSFTIEGNKVRLKFTDAEGLRIHGGGDLKGFAIRGATGDWVWATGKIDGQDILLWSDLVALPTAVRYAWAMNPVISVENGAGLPLCPFRTDGESPN